MREWKMSPGKKTVAEVWNIYTRIGCQWFLSMIVNQFEVGENWRVDQEDWKGSRISNQENFVVA